MEAAGKSDARLLWMAQVQATLVPSHLPHHPCHARGLVRVLERLMHYTAAEVMHAVCHLMKVDYNDVVGRMKPNGVVKAREAFVGAMRHLTAYSYPEIAVALGRDSHGTTASAFNRFSKRDPCEQADFIRAVRDYVEAQRAQRENDAQAAAESAAYLRTVGVR